MTPGYVLRRLLMFVIVVWGAASLNFVLPRIPTGQWPTLVEYTQYLWGVAQLDFGRSRLAYPSSVISLISYHLPWTIGLMFTTTAIAFTLGTLLGGLMAWPRAPRLVKLLTVPFLALSATPYYLFGLILAYVLAYQLHWFPIFGLYTVGTMPSFTIEHILDVLHHSVMPALSIVVTATGMWALTMRGMMVTVLDADFVLQAEAKGLREWRVFLRYALRNALLPQVTGLGLALGHIVSGAVLVELVFAYPGIGLLLRNAIRQYDYPLITGIVYMIILAIATVTLILDLLYPRIDPTIRYRRD